MNARLVRILKLARKGAIIEELRVAVLETDVVYCEAKGWVRRRRERVSVWNHDCLCHEARLVHRLELLNPHGTAVLYEIEDAAAAPEQGTSTATAAPTPAAPVKSEWYVDLDQAATTVNRKKRSMEHFKRRKNDPLPTPDVAGGGGRKDEWKWSTIRPWLERNFSRDLSHINPDNLPV